MSDQSAPSLTGSLSSSDTVVGASADIATVKSCGAGEFGPGKCLSTNAFCFKAVPVMGTTIFSVAGWRNVNGIDRAGYGRTVHWRVFYLYSGHYDGPDSAKWVFLPHQRSDHGDCCFPADSKFSNDCYIYGRWYSGRNRCHQLWL